MENTKKPLAILNLAGELSSELNDYFMSRGITVINPLENFEVKVWTHILTRDIHYFEDINKTYNLAQTGGHIVSLTKVDDLQNFTMNFGNLILDDNWFKGPMGNFIMDKYLQGYGGINLGDSYPTFKELGSFAIVNPFSTGEYIDRVVQKGFETGVEALAVKTFSDHLIMYIAGLKNKGKAGVPIEVTYGSFDNIFAVQFHFYSQNLKLIDIGTSLSSVMTRKPEEYFLNVTAQSTDFFDLSCLPEVNKIMITGLWTQDQRIKFENRGFMLMDIKRDAPQVATIPSEESLLSLKESDLPFQDFSDRIVIPDTLPTKEETVTVVSGGETEAQSSTVVKELLSLTEDEIHLLKGDSELDDLIQKVKGKFEADDNVIHKISGGNFDIDEVAFKIASNVEKTSHEHNLRVRSLIDKLPTKIKTGLFDFAKNISKEVEELDESDMSNFHLLKMPEIIQAELEEVANETSKNVDTFSKENEVKIKLLENELNNTKQDNERLKVQMKGFAAEIRILKEARKKLAESQMKAKEAASHVTAKKDDSDDELRRHFQQHLNAQKALNEQDMKKLASLLDREAKLISSLKQEEMKSRKLQLESTQKDNFFAQEIEKAERDIKAKELLVIKTKETFTKLAHRKEQELDEMKAKMQQLEGALAVSSTSTNTFIIRDLERQNQHLAKQLEFHKNKVASMVANMQPAKTDVNYKEEVRKLQMMTQQLKNQVDLAQNEVEKLNTKTGVDQLQINSLRQEKARLEQLLKKTATEAMESPSHSQGQPNDQELKRFMAQNQILETQMRESSQKVVALEAKLAEALKPQRPASGGDETSKVKVNQLETSVKKLTQDLVESRNQLSDAKKETNKLRQEKTALQNQIDKLKKDADKTKTAAPKKGKAA